MSASASSGDFRAAYARLVEQNGDEHMRALLDGLSGLMQTPAVVGFAATGKLRGAEKAAFQAAIVSYLDWVRWREAFGDSMVGQLPPFDLLSPFQRVGVVADLAVGLLIGGTPLPPESVEHHAGFQAMFMHLMEQIEIEIDNEEEGERVRLAGRDGCEREGGIEEEQEEEKKKEEERDGDMYHVDQSKEEAFGRVGENRMEDEERMTGKMSAEEMGMCLVREGHRMQIEDRRTARKARKNLRKARNNGQLEATTAPIDHCEIQCHAEGELERMTRVMNDMFGDNEGEEEEEEEEEEEAAARGGGRSGSSSIAMNGCCNGDGGCKETKTDKATLDKDEHDHAPPPSTTNDADPFRYYWRGLLNRMILERHAANPLLNGPAASELHVAAQSTVCPEETCTDVERWVHSHRMVLGAGFHVDPQESYLTNGVLDIHGMARGEQGAIHRFDQVTRRVDQKSREFAKTWTPEKWLLARRTIHVLALDDDVAAIVGTPGQDMSSLAEVERSLLDGKKSATPQEDYMLKNAAQQLWRRRFLHHMEGKQWCNLQARLKALKRTMDSERALGLHDAVAPYHALDSEFGYVETHGDWLELADVHRIWKKGSARKVGYCAVCWKKPEEGEKLKVCGKCFLSEYCSREHQEADWKAHKPFCKKWREGRW